MPGTFYGVSVGPGDPELLTLKAVRIIERCGIIAVPRTRGEKMLALSIAEQSADLSGKKIVPIDFPMSMDKNVLCKNYDKAAELICAELDKDDIAMLVLGDISIYSTFGYVAERVARRGIMTEICPGITSFSAASSALGRTLVQNSGQLKIVPYGCDNFEDILESSGTKVVMKTGSHACELIEILRKKNLLERTSAVESCGLPDERIYPVIDDSIKEFSYFTVFIVWEQE